MEKQEDGRFYVETSAGTRFHAKVVIIAAGVGSFQARPLKVKGIEKFEGTQLHYSCKDPSIFEGKNVVILGGGDSALDWTLNARPKASCSCTVATASAPRPLRSRRCANSAKTGKCSLKWVR